MAGLDFLRTMMNPNPAYPINNTYMPSFAPQAQSMPAPPVAQPVAPPLPVFQEDKLGKKDMLRLILSGMGQAIATGNPSAAGAVVSAKKAELKQLNALKRKSKFAADYFTKLGKPELAAMAAGGEPDIAFEFFKATDRTSDLPMSYKEWKLMQENPEYKAMMETGKPSSVSNEYKQFQEMQKDPAFKAAMEAAGKYPTHGFVDKYQQAQDAKTLANLRKSAEAVDQLKLTTDAATKVLLGPDAQQGTADDFKTGILTSTKGTIAKWWAGAMDLLGSSSPSASDYASKVETIDAASKQLGLMQMQLIGGNDTERELAVSIQTTISPNKRPETNLELLKQKLKAISILEERPTFYSIWKEKYGSLAALDEEKKSAEQRWREFQREAFKMGEGGDLVNQEINTPQGKVKILSVTGVEGK